MYVRFFLTFYSKTIYRLIIKLIIVCIRCLTNVGVTTLRQQYHCVPIVCIGDIRFRPNTVSRLCDVFVSNRAFCFNKLFIRRFQSSDIPHMLA